MMTEICIAVVFVFSCVSVASSGQSSSGQSVGSSASHVCCSTRSGVRDERPPSLSNAPSVPAVTSELTDAGWHDPTRARCLPGHKSRPRGQRPPHASHGALCPLELIAADERPAEPSGDVRRAADAQNCWIGEI